MKYLDEVLIKLRRTYSKDEVVAALNKKLSETEFNFGLLKSDYEELLYKYELLNNAHKRTCERLKEVSSIVEDKKTLNALIQIKNAKKDTIKEKDRIITELRKANIDLILRLNDKI